MSEAFADLDFIYELYHQKKISQEYYIELLKNCIKIQFKPTVQRKTLR